MNFGSADGGGAGRNDSRDGYRRAMTDVRLNGSDAMELGQAAGVPRGLVRQRPGAAGRLN
jgi:hypothetical protein